MPQFGGKDTKRHFTVVMGGKEHGLYVSSTPSSAAKKAVTKLCAANKSKKVEFEIREITQGSKKKTYGPYSGYIEKLKEPIELKGRVIKYKPVAKLSGKTGAKKGGMKGGATLWITDSKKGTIVCNKPESSMSKSHILFNILYDDFISSQSIFRLLNLSTAYMEGESNNLARYVPGESAENATTRTGKARNNKKIGTTAYLKAMTSYEGNKIQNSELTNIYIYIDKKNTGLIDEMKKIKRNEKSFIQIKENEYNFQ
jgi:hypothetical protein